MNFFLDGRSFEQKIADAIDFLKYNGYIVSGPVLEKTSVKEPYQLVRFFYDTLLKYNPDRVFIFSGGDEKELSNAKKLVDDRIAVGCSKDRAYWEACRIIEALIKYENLLGLTRPIVSLGLFGSEKMAWVVEKVLNILNGLDKEAVAEEDLRYYEFLYKQQEDQYYKSQGEK